MIPIFYFIFLLRMGKKGFDTLKAGQTFRLPVINVVGGSSRFDWSQSHPVIQYICNALSRQQT